MAHTLEELERLEQELRERLADTDALERVKEAKRQARSNEPTRTIHRALRGQWQSQIMEGMPSPRAKRND